MKAAGSLGTTVEFCANPRDNFHLPKGTCLHSTIHHSDSVLRLLQHMVVPKINQNPWLMGRSISPKITGTVSICITFATKHLSDNKSLFCECRIKLLMTNLFPDKRAVVLNIRQGWLSDWKISNCIFNDDFTLRLPTYIISMIWEL